MFSVEQLRNPSGKLRTKALFYELSYDDTSFAILTLKPQDIEAHGKYYVSLHKLYIAMVPNDPTEYEFAQTVFGSWETWQQMQKSPLLRGYFEKWRKEATVKIKSHAIQAIAMEMKEGGRSSFSAAKLLLEKGWLDKDNASQAKKKLQAKEEAEMDREALHLLSDDAQRLGIKVN